MTDVATIQRAREDARRARLRVSDDVALLRQRLSPAAIASDAAADARQRVVTVAGEAATLAQNQPAVAIGGVAAVGAVLAIPPLRRAVFSIARTVLRNPTLVGRLLRRR